MPEILTESFCERCGTRYTFESAAPRRARLKGLRVMSRGFKNYVMSDDSSLDEAMAAARSDTDREVTTQQLDAFHKTFKFCMSCRQYTCGDCWNEAEGRCLSCSPSLGPDVLEVLIPAADQGLEPLQPAANGHQVADRNGHHDHAPSAPLAWPSSDLMRSIEADEPTAAAVDEVILEAPLEPEAAAAWADPGVDAEEIEPLDAVDLEARLGIVGPAAATEDETQAEAEIDERAAVAASQTTEMLGRFRPGESLDDAIAAYELDLTATPAPEPEYEPVAAAPEPEYEPVAAAPEPEYEPVAATPEPEPEYEPVAAAPEPEYEPVAATPEPEPEYEPLAAAPEPEYEPVAAAPEPEYEPVAAAPEPESEAEPASRGDLVAQPTWQIVAPEGASQEAPAPIDPTPAPRPAPEVEPTWPAQPEWPTGGASGLQFLGRPAAATGGLEALWAESAREVANARAAGTPASTSRGIQPCVSCGLSLSATARFCRRCGSRQG